MINKEQIKCKYKFQDKEKFDGKPYCTCFNELCEDLSFTCDDNCQIYEDYKQLARKTQECEDLREALKEEVIYKRTYLKGLLDCKEECEALQKQCNRLELQNHKLKQECEELKEEIEALERINCRKDEELLRRLTYTSNAERQRDRYRKALEEIEEVINNILNSCLGRNTVGCRPAHNVCGDLIKILDIINKAKEN